MKRIMIIGLGLLLLVVVVIIGYEFLRPTPVPQTTVEPITFPVATSTDAIPQAEITLRDGSRVTVNDFTKSQSTVVDNQDPSTLYLSGDPGLCQANASCAEGTDKSFEISFDKKAGLFSITLLKEPLGEVRHEAEQALQTALGLPQDKMCNLNYTLGTLGFVNEVYGGQELRFSFCPGAVPLP